MVRNATMALLLLALLLLVGCGRARQAQQAVQAGRQLQQEGRATIQTDEGEVQIETDKAGEQTTVTVEDESGQKQTMTTGKAMATSELSLPVYPGATQEYGQVVTTDEGKQLNFSFTTTDSFDKVADFYKSKCAGGKISDIQMPGQRLLNIGLGEPPDMTSVAVQQAEGEDKVTIIIIEAK